MAEDADRHVLGDPITRMVQSTAFQPPSVADDRRARDLSDTVLRREVANLELIVAEAPQRGIAPDTLRQVEQRLRELHEELVRRGHAPIEDDSSGAEPSWRRGPVQ